MKTTWYAAVLFGGLLVSGCAGDDNDKDETADTGTETTPGEPGTIIDVLTLEGEFSTYLGGALIGNLTPILDDPKGGPYTVFAPTDDAFEQAFADLGIADPTALIGNTPLLSALLEYHIVESVIRSSDVTAPGFATTRAGTTLFYNADGGTVKLNGGAEAGTTGGADVTTADLEASNGVVHVIERVMLPPDVVSAAVYATRSGNAALGELVDALDGAGLAENFRIDLPTADLTALDLYTVFAPLDDGFPDDAPDALGLQYHVIPGSFESGALPPLSPTLAVKEYTGLKTPASLPLTVFFDGTSVNGGTAGLGADVVAADILTLNGTVHVVDQVLAPLNVPEMADVAGLSTLLDAVATSEPIDGTPVADALAAEPIAVLAPTNAAFDAAFPGGLPANGAAILAVLANHVITPTNTLPTVESLLKVPTAQTLDAEATFDVGATPPTVTIAGGNAANIELADLGADNGVVHVIDTVLIVP